MQGALGSFRLRRQNLRANARRQYLGYVRVGEMESGAKTGAAMTQMLTKRERKQDGIYGSLEVVPVCLGLLFTISFSQQHMYPDVAGDVQSITGESLDAWPRAGRQ
ncbi:hypothetical protein D4764_09G0006070 [Takifugu flavidus]|uniref:Uncharacterized protein n=1 Tax=Takifugu flavidus TaxID=433684 RepID=A0A5C6MLR2_9TELE|nr:hypothetical protein D4764_09G0006070 [Takifugu flavidus]